jgi:nucleoside-diphosphate-sugar epimerase
MDEERFPARPARGPAVATATEQQPVAFVSGVGGYLGDRVASTLRLRGWRVVGLTRQPRPGSDAHAFQLGREISSALLAGGNALVHCAYDFSQRSWEEIRRVNVAGSEKLLRAARDAQVENLVYISSISAFEGCRALYGRAKLETERLVKPLGATIIRPGLIWGERPGATFGRLVSQVERARVLPLFGGGQQIQFAVHEQDLANAVYDFVDGKLSRPAAPVTVAHEQPWTFRELLAEIARAKERNVVFVPVPWRLGWAILKLAELSGLRLNFRSDNLLSLMYQNPNPSFAEQRKLGIVCRKLKLK